MPEKKAETAAELIRRARLALNMSQEELGKALGGKSRKTILRWEKGETEPKHSIVAKVQELLRKKRAE